MDSTALSLVVLGTLVFAAHVFSELFSRKRVPDLLLLLIIGIIIGPVFKIVTPEDLGGFGQVFSTLTLVIILFEGGSELSLSNIRTSFKDMIGLTLVSYFLIMIVFGILGHYILQLPWATSFFMSAVLGGAAEAIVIPLTKHLKISENSKATLVLETSFSTVVCFIISLALFNAVKSQQFEIGKTIGNIISSFVLAGIIGFAGAVFWAIVLQKIRTVKNSTFTTPAFVFIIYGINSILGFSGEIAALTFGITLTNIDAVYNSIFKKLFKNKPNSLNYNERMLFSEMAFLLRTFVFVYIGISIQLNDWKSILIGLAITLILLILRILSVRWTVVRNKDGYTEMEAMYMSCMVSKGLVAAILAALLKQAGLPFADEVQNIVYSVILFSIVFTCAMIPLLEKSKFIQKTLLFMLYFPRKKEDSTIKPIDNQEDKIE
ncbi:MAG: cation:proton antiporter [Bacteroidales bacterium]|nr:cation:proton antiporter [Bacteroidales bacterium]MDY6075838.1 cation:proton antiporter [Bacteroidales bacterium]